MSCVATPNITHTMKTIPYNTKKPCHNGSVSLRLSRKLENNRYKNRVVSALKQ